MEEIYVIKNPSKQYYPCLVHCRFGVDKDMVLDENYGIFICESLKGEIFGGDVYCGFQFPCGLSKKEIDALAEKRIRELKKLK